MLLNRFASLETNKTAEVKYWHGLHFSICAIESYSHRTENSHSMFPVQVECAIFVADGKGKTPGSSAGSLASQRGLTLSWA